MVKKRAYASKGICLSEFLKIQRNFQERYYPIEKIDISSLAAAIASEAMEIWAVSGKWWCKKRHLEIEDLKEESIDIFHFLLGLWLKLGMNEKEITNLYKKKMQINIQRQNSNALSK